MFKLETVFVLGAGASWHYGYPTGEQLVSDVVECAKIYLVYCRGRVSAGVNIDDMPIHMTTRTTAYTPEAYVAVWNNEIGDCEQLINRLTYVEPIVIDNFLGWNEPLHDLGKMLIAAALLKREAHGAGLANYNKSFLGPVSARDRSPTKDNWIRFVVHQLLVGWEAGGSLLGNKVHFITFNYDRSLELNLARALGGVNAVGDEDVRKFLGGDRITHMYGSLRKVTATSPGDYDLLTQNFSAYGSSASIAVVNGLVNKWSEAAADLLVIDPHTKGLGGSSALAAKLLTQAEQIYFLGFGFDEENVRRLGLPMPASHSHGRRYYFTNMDDSGTVNRQASRALGLSASAAADAARIVSGNVVAEKSVRDTYIAIALDFGGLAE